ncbi:MAG: 5-(carboxyamino)imidazole ribonucleotide synthase [Dehalococcoidia bacterium]
MTADRFPVVGIVGAGQLARMMMQASVGLGIEVRVLAERPDDSAALVCPHVDIGVPTSVDDLRAFGARCDVVTLDHELVDLDALAAVEETGAVVRPDGRALRYAQDKLYQRTRFAEEGLPVPAFGDAPDLATVDTFAATHGWPVVAKAQRGGYDGRGVWVLPDLEAASALFAETAGGDVALMVETWVPIERELAVLVARRPGGECVVYPVVETVQRDGICHEVVAPAPLDDTTAAEAGTLGLRIAELTGAVGIIATELFVTDSGLVINEVATRPHNSGHFSIDGCRTSQFENHLRAVLDWPLGPTDLVAPAVVMANMLGTEDTPGLPSRLARALADGGAGVYPHLYGKASRPGRKIGHVNALGDDPVETRGRAVRAAAVLTGRAM